VANIGAKAPEFIEEYEGNEPTGVEADPEEETGRVIEPYDPTKIRVDPKVYSVRQVLDMIDDKELDLAPDFQRRRVWRVKQKSLLIESILLRIPLPAFYFNSDIDGRLQVVDGVQRLSTIYDFVRSGVMELTELEYLGEELGGKTYEKIKGTNWGRRILNTQIFANVIDPQTPIRVKFDIFKRINTGGSPLNAQEIRHCMSKDRARNFLKHLCEMPAFQEVVGPSMVNHVRMADREFALRYISFKLVGDVGAYKGFASMEEFLNGINESLDNPETIPDNVLNFLASGFKHAMQNAYFLFGAHAFRKWPENYSGYSPINRALFDVWSVALSDFPREHLAKFKEPLVEGARRLMTDHGPFISAISTGTSSPSKVVTRFDCVADLIGRTTSDH